MLLLACSGGTEPENCSLALHVAPHADTIPIGGYVAIYASNLSALPPGNSCGPAELTWRVSDASRASLTVVSNNQAVVTGRSPGILAVRVHGRAKGHEADDSAMITITPS